MRLVIAEDNYSERLKGIFGTIKEFNGVEIVTATNLAETKVAIEDSEGIPTVVFTDMFLPDKVAPLDADEAIKIYTEMCEYYGINAQKLDELIDKVRPMLTELYQKSASLRSLLKEHGVADYTHDQLLSAFLYEYNKRNDVSEEIKAQIGEWNVYERKHGEVLIETLREADRSGLFDVLRRVRLEDKSESGGITWGFGVGLINGFVGGGCQGMPMGIRIAQEANKHGMPVAIVSGDHGTSALPLISVYLRDTGVIASAKQVIPWNVLEQDGSFKSGGKELVDQSSFFIANKGYKGEIDHSDQQAWTDHMLIQIVKSLLKRLD